MVYRMTLSHSFVCDCCYLPLYSFLPTFIKHTNTMASKSSSKPSKLLNSQENQLLIKLLGNRVQSLATAVVQFFIAFGDEWSLHVSLPSHRLLALCTVKIDSNYNFKILCQKNSSNMFIKCSVYVIIISTCLNIL